MVKPFISIVVIAYNRREFIKDALKSIINSVAIKDNYELIVIKNFKDEYADCLVRKLSGARAGLGEYVGYDEATIIGGIYGGWGKYLAKAAVNLLDGTTITRLASIILGLTYLLSPYLAKRLIYLYYTKVFDVWGSEY